MQPGKLPFVLPKTLKAVQEPKPELPGFDKTTDGEPKRLGCGQVCQVVVNHPARRH